MITALTTPGPAASAQPSSATIDRVMTHLGFDASLRQALLDGKILSTGMPEMEQMQNELAVAAVMLVVNAPMRKVVEAYLDRDVFRKGSDIIVEKRLRMGEAGRLVTPSDFEAAGFTEAEKAEADRMLAFTGGESFNFSQLEIQHIRTASSTDLTAREGASQLLRQILMERCKDYLRNGMDAIAPYERSRGKRSQPGRELTLAVTSTRLLEAHFPGVYRSLLAYPEVVDATIGNEFYWFKHRMDNRPMFQLSHYMTDIRDAYAIVAEVQFYVGHTYGALFTLIGCFPHEDGTVVFCTNRTFTDKVVGVGGTLKRNVGRQRIEGAIADHFATLRTMLSSAPTR